MNAYKLFLLFFLFVSITFQFKTTELSLPSEENVTIDDLNFTPNFY